MFRSVQKFACVDLQTQRKQYRNRDTLCRLTVLTKISSTALRFGGLPVRFFSPRFTDVLASLGGQLGVSIPNCLAYEAGAEALPLWRRYGRDLR